MDQKVKFLNRLPEVKDFKSFLNKGRMVVFIDEKVEKNWGKNLEGTLLKKSFLTLSFKASEKNKCLKMANSYWEKLLENKIDRHDFAVIIGGGITLDLGGFIFSLYKRGMPFFYLPTTLLSQVDSTVGGKVAVNFQGKKNIIGAFSPPKASLVCPSFLKTLPKRDFKSGFSELFKHYILRGELGPLENLLINPIDERNLTKILKKSLKFKQEIVDKDPFDLNERKSLNLGHSIAHALEAIAASKRIKIYHGEAVSIGILAESYLSYKKGFLNKTSFEQVERIFKKHQLMLSPAFDFSLAEFQNNLIYDKKNRQGKNLMVLWSKKRVKIGYIASEGDIKALFKYLTKK